ncbi:MAG: photosystem II reaction center protein PsbN [Oscillatoria princeps RMCB-10]|jgi:PsbN protein|nr:photosystem II reaction center protein PsbN [Oscillatoria princeps RMCB-10]MCU0517334.1 photosystem II reaction center protein PsbN [Oscillatoria sp. Prado101]
MESATVLIISIGAVLVAITGFSIYTSFGPPSKQLADPFDDHED